MNVNDANDTIHKVAYVRSRYICIYYKDKNINSSRYGMMIPEFKLIS